MSDATQSNEPSSATAAAVRWRPLSAIDRRVLGVLVEKAKTTPDVYPMSLNALRSSANQKNNRFPIMELELDDIEESLTRLRAVGAVAEVQGGGRVPRFRHYFYEWLGVDKVEAAVMTELLLRGTQTEGELRSRAARMEPIADLTALRPVLASLKQKGLVIALTPEGRGHIVTHGLYEPRELEKQRAEVAAGGHASADSVSEQSPEGLTASPARRELASSHSEASGTTSSAGELRQELDELKAEVARLRKDVDDLSANLR